MKKTAIIQLFAIICLFASCERGSNTIEKGEILETGNLQARYTNNTGIDVYGVIANEKEIGNFKSGETTNYILYETFGADTGMPDVEFQGIVNGNIIYSTSRFNWCGTEKTTITEGILDISVELVEYTGIEPSKYFNLKFTKIDVPSPLVNKTWKFTQINGYGSQSISIIDNYSIIFKDETTVEFPLNCNVCCGTYTCNKNSYICVYGRISFSDFLQNTEKYCEELSDLENYVVNNLQKAYCYYIFDKNLTINCENNCSFYFECEVDE
jgi:hypothetical protein